MSSSASAFQVQITLQMGFNDSLTNESSVQFHSLSQAVCAQVRGSKCTQTSREVQQHVRRPHATCDEAFHPGKSEINFLSCLVVTQSKF